RKDLWTSFQHPQLFFVMILQIAQGMSCPLSRGILSGVEGILTAFLLLVLSVTVETRGSGFRCGTGNHLACTPRNYSKFDLPIKKGVNHITVSIDIAEVLRINDKDYSITFSGYFNVKWQESRMELSPDFGEEVVGPGVNITNNPNIVVPMSTEFVKDVWMPDIFIYSLKTYKVMDVLNKLAGLWIGADKTILYSQATHITFICPMRFDKFPLDTQVCKFQVGSCSYDDTKMQFSTENAGYVSPKTANSIALDYDIQIKMLSKEDQVFLGGGLGNFSLAGFELWIIRYSQLDQFFDTNGRYPRENGSTAEGLTAIEAWMLACILFVFGALIE
ncbi:Gammaaminobutyric acid receptor subunit deltalike, partial [Caligus rogercresseyi]